MRERESDLSPDLPTYFLLKITVALFLLFFYLTLLK